MRNTVFIFIALLAFSGCSTKILLPYEDEPRCKPSNGYGDCGSVSNIYKEIHSPKRIEK